MSKLFNETFINAHYTKALDSHLRSLCSSTHPLIVMVVVVFALNVVDMLSVVIGLADLNIQLFLIEF